MATVKRLDFAFIDCDESILFLGGDKEKKRPIGCFAWLIEDADGYTLVDAGVADIDAVNATKRGTSRWERGEKGMPLTAHLERLGISPDEIRRVVITHAHYDHISGLSCLTDADIYISRDAYESLLDENNPFATQLQETKAFALEAAARGKVFFTEDGHKVTDRIRTIACGGHIVGGQMVEYHGEKSALLFTGDEIFLRANVESKRRIGLSYNADAAQKALEYCCAFAGEILTGHDLGCLEEYDV